MKLKKEFLTYLTEEDSILVPRGGSAFSGMVRGNRTFGKILQMLETDTTEEKITAALIRQYPDAAERIRRDVNKVIENLKEIGALE